MNSAITWESIDQGTRLSIRDLARSTIETIRRLLSIGRERADTDTATRVLIEIAIDELVRTGASEEQVLEMMAQALHGAKERSGAPDRDQTTAAQSRKTQVDPAATKAEAGTSVRAASQGGQADWDDAAAPTNAGDAGSAAQGGDGVAWGSDSQGGAAAHGEQDWQQNRPKAAKPNIEVASGAVPGYPYRVQLVSPEGNVVRVLSVRGGEYDIKVWLKRNIDKFPGYGWRLINPSGVLIASEDPK